MIFSTLPLKTWSFSRNVYARLELVTTTASIFPLMSLTVPCNTSSGIERQRLPVVQLGPGPDGPPTRNGLTNGSLRPAAPLGRAGSFFAAAGTTSAALTGRVALVAAVGLPVFVAPVPVFVGFAATTGGLAAVLVGIDVFLELLAAPCVVFTVLVCVESVPESTGGFPLPPLVAAVLVVLEDVLVPACWLVVAPGMDVLLAPEVLTVPAAGLVPFVAALPGVGLGDGLLLPVAALLPLGFCAVAIVAMAIASARILISFISVPFDSSSKNLYFPGCAATGAGGFTGLAAAPPGAAGAPGPAAAPGAPAVAGAAAEGSRLKNVVAMQLARTVSPGAY